MDAQPNDQVMQALWLGQTDGTAHQPFDRHCQLNENPW
jgi:hypothetical protein